MLSSTFIFVLSGCLLGVVHIAVGIAVGMWLRRSERGGSGPSHGEIRQAERIAQRLQALADDMSSCVDEHRLQIARASRQLSEKSGRFDPGAAGVADVVAGVISEVVGANQTLQLKLNSAEARLQEQATEIEAQMSRAMTDALTGLPNRREFNERLEASMEAWRQRGEAFSLLMLDVDHFKQLNDQNGHVAGDHVLTAVGHALRGVLRRADIVARYGGEEFAMLLPATSLDQAAGVAKKVCRAIAVAEMDHDGKRFRVTASGGLAMIQGSEEAAALVGRADAALYAAKQAGRNRIFIHDGSGCRPLDDESSCGESDLVAPAGDEPAQIAALLEMVEALVHSSNKDGSSDALGPHGHDAHEAISAQLSEACEELRRTMAQRHVADDIRSGGLAVHSPATY